MTLESLRLLRNILLRSVLVGIGLRSSGIACSGAWDTWIRPITQLCRTDEAHVSSLVLTLFTEMRFFSVFVLLTPALAIHWTIKRRAFSRTENSI